MKIEKKYLNRLKKNKLLVDIYTDRYNETHYGYIVDFNDEFLILEAIDDDSNPNGVTVFFRENITRVRWGGNQITSVEKLIDQSQRLKSIDNIELTSIQSVLQCLQDSYGYINVYFEDIDDDVCFIGEIEEMDEDVIVIHEYGTKISLDRKNIMIPIGEITKVEAGGSYEEQIKTLMKKRLKKA